MRCLVTGAAGFIGSHLAERLLHMGHSVVGVDNLITGEEINIRILEKKSKDSNAPFLFKHVDLSDCDESEDLVKHGRFDVIFHNAALGSIPRSFEHPELYQLHNVSATRCLFLMACEYEVPRVIYASSSSVYGDVGVDEKTEDYIGKQLNPYALSKRLNELEADMLAYSFTDTKFIGLRYFNVFGPRQRSGPYAAVVAEWLDAIKSGRDLMINGDVEIMRDFTYVDNVTYMNMLCVMLDRPAAMNTVFNVAAGEAVTLHSLLHEICYHAAKKGYKIPAADQGPMRANDVRVSFANIDKAKKLVGYEPTHNWRKGIQLTCESVL